MARAACNHLHLVPSLVHPLKSTLFTNNTLSTTRTRFYDIQRRFSSSKISMSLRAGIVGLPNVGKSTLFNAVVENGKAQAANFPFCTIEPNVGIVAVPDSRLSVLSDLSKSQRSVPASIEFVDIAGLVKGASQGEGLGNKFLSHIREVDSILQVVRCFEDNDIVHVNGKVDPKSDIDVINLELVFSDLDQIFGPESSGKTTLALHAIAEVQKLGGNAMLVDAEHAFDPAYSKALGVDVENLIVCQPDHGEMALEIADRMCRSGAIDLICVDSVSALTPRAEIEGEIGMQQIGLQARLMSQALRKMSGNASKAGCTLVFLNQIRYKIGVYYGNPEVTSGGIALKFFASLRLEVRPIGKIKSAKGDEEIGLKVRLRVQKSKVSRPYKIAEFEIIFGEGISKLGCILDCAEMTDIVSKKGSWYSYGDHRLGQGRDKAIQYLKENTYLLEEIEKVVRSSLVDGSNQASLAHMKNSPVLHQDDDIFEESQ